MKGENRVRGGIVAGVIALLLAACGLVGGVGTPVFQMQSVALRAAADANATSPTAVDLVFVYDPAIIDTLQAVTAADWFARKRQFQLDFPDGIGIKGWEVVPSSVLPVWTVPEEMLENKSGDSAVAAFIFADYLSPGAHRARLESRSGIRIDLRRDAFTLEPLVQSN